MCVEIVSKSGETGMSNGHENNLKKTEYIKMCWGRIPIQNIWFGDYKFEQVESYTFLGKALNNNASQT